MAGPTLPPPEPTQYADRNTKFGNVMPSGKSGGQDGFVKNAIPLENGGDTGASEGSPYGDFLSLARENFNVARNYFDIAVRKRMEDNLAHAYSRHASGSKFHTPDYDKRSKVFRPKTRTMLRKHEAAHALAFHSTRDTLDCQPLDPDNEANVIAAEVKKELLNYRMRHSIPWFKISQGAYHDAMTQGIVCSCQEWRYREAEIVNDLLDDNNSPTGESSTETVVLQDTSWVRLIPAENILFHPSSDWVDPVNSSPYLIEMIPWFAPELAERIKDARQYGSQVPYLRDFTEQELLAGSSEQSNSMASVRMAREPNRVDRIGQVQQGQKFRPVWVHRNIVRLKGLDYVYETLGTNIMLSEPVPIEEVFGIKKRPYVCGLVAIEPHRLYPAGPVEHTKGLQEGINNITNQRTDNINLSIMNRWLVKRGQMVDSRSLMRGVPGSITMTTDPTGDVKQIDTKDVTSNAYEEQDRYSSEFDEMSGLFSQATIGGMRNLNETVGGMEFMGQNADIVTELSLQTLSRTWVEPVLDQLGDLESVFCTDQKILTLVSNRTKSKDWIAAFRSLQDPVNMTVSVGFGNTDPMKRIQRFQLAAQATATIAPDLMQQINQREAVHEIWGAAGFKDGTRFFPSLAETKDTPQVVALKKQMEQLQQQLDEATKGIPVAKIKAESAERIAKIKEESKQNIAKARHDLDMFKAETQGQLKQIDQEIAREVNLIKKASLLLEREALSNAIMQADRAFELQVATTPAIPLQSQADVEVPAAQQQIIDRLQSPGSAEVVQEIGANGAANLPGKDSAGVISRGDFGMIPGSKG